METYNKNQEIFEALEAIEATKKCISQHIMYLMKDGINNVPKRIEKLEGKLEIIRHYEDGDEITLGIVKEVCEALQDKHCY